MTANPRATRFLALCNEAAERLGGNTQPTDANAQHLAALRLSQEEYVARLIDGVEVNPDVLLRLDEAIRAAAPRKIPKVEIVVVNPVHCLCPSCSHEFEPAETGSASCPQCGVRFVPTESAVASRERAQAKVASPDRTNGNTPPTPSAVAPSGTLNEPEAGGSAECDPYSNAPEARAAKAAKLKAEAEERALLLARTAPPIVRRNGATDGALCFIGGVSGSLPGGSAERDLNPYRSITGGPREPWKP